MSNGCPQAEAIREQTAAMREQTQEIRLLRMAVKAGIREVQPVLTSVKGFCQWIRKWGPWFLGSIPGVLVAIGAISPNAANALQRLLMGFGG